MKRNLSRRDFLKFAGMGLGAIALSPINLESVYTPKPLPQFPNNEMLGRLLGTTRVTNRPSNDPFQASALGTLYDDKLVEWGHEVVGNAVGLTNQRFFAGQPHMFPSPKANSV